MWREAAVLAGAAGCACLALSEYEKKHFSVEAAAIVSDKIYRDRTIVFLSDLHNNEFGCTNQKLVQAIHGLKPDAVTVRRGYDGEQKRKQGHSGPSPAFLNSWLPGILFFTGMGTMKTA